ncbi:hypothetical protein [Embleya sp. NPDC059237]|uniref:hypothetical protein n=1 Tax=Embleya sp. NPDC059237 TaxID=3346784 RepID=UPI0036CE2D37
MAKKRIVWASVAVAAGLLVMGGGTPAQAAAQSVVYEPSTVTWYGKNCKAWINTQKTNGAWYAQGLVHSWNGGKCTMILQRKHDGVWSDASNPWSVTNGQTNTGWHWDDKGYKAAVCVIDWNIATNSNYHCGYAGAV